MKKIYMVTDLGPGDGGKGGVVHKLAHLRKAHTIVKVGGAQGSHGVRTASGQAFAFSQFGCGTFEGVRTHLSSRFVMDPIGLINEAYALRYEAGVYEPLSLLTIDESALVNTPFHGIASRIKELSLLDSPRGTVGTGVGQTYRLHQSHPELSIFARDLGSPQLREKLMAVREYVTDELKPLLSGHFFPADQERLTRDVALLSDEGFVSHILEQFENVSRTTRVVDEEYFGQEILGRDGVIVSEASHGILTDQYAGFHPHTSALRTLPRFTRAMFESAHYDGEIVSLGIHRAYQIRHGAGPMVTHDPALSATLLPGSSKDDNRWQGQVRVGPLDLVMLRYALAASGEGAYDGLAITWFDQIEKRGEWSLATQYRGTHDPQFFTPAGDIKPHDGEDEARLAHQGELTKLLQAFQPEVMSLSLPRGASRDELYALCAEILQEQLRVPVRMISFGPTERDKVCK